MCSKAGKQGEGCIGVHGQAPAVARRHHVRQVAFCLNLDPLWRRWGRLDFRLVWWRLDFGRPVEIDKIVVYVRARFGHDSWWKSGVIEFSDGTKQTFDLEKSAKPQEISFERRTVTWLRLAKLKPVENKWCAFSEVQVWGRDSTSSERSDGKPGSQP